MPVARTKQRRLGDPPRLDQQIQRISLAVGLDVLDVQAHEAQQLRVVQRRVLVRGRGPLPLLRRRGHLLVRQVADQPARQDEERLLRPQLGVLAQQDPLRLPEVVVARQGLLIIEADHPQQVAEQLGMVPLVAIDHRVRAELPATLREQQLRRVKPRVHRQEHPRRQHRIDEARRVADQQPARTRDPRHAVAPVALRPHRRHPPRRRPEHARHQLAARHRRLEALAAAGLALALVAGVEAHHPDRRPRRRQREQPQPVVALRHEQRLTLARRRQAPGRLVVGPRRLMLQPRDRRAQPELAGQQRRLARRVDRPARARLVLLILAAPTPAHPDHPLALPQRRAHGRVHVGHRPGPPRRVEQDLVEARALDQVRVVIRVRVREPQVPARRGPPLPVRRPALRHEARRLDLRQRPHPLEDRHDPRQQALADVHPRMRVRLEQQHPQPPAGRTRGHAGARRPAADDDQVPAVHVRATLRAPPRGCQPCCLLPPISPSELSPPDRESTHNINKVQ